MEEFLPKIMQMFAGQGSEVDGLQGQQQPPVPEQNDAQIRQVTGNEDQDSMGQEEAVLDALLSGGSVDVQGTLDFSWIPDPVRQAISEVVSNFTGDNSDQEAEESPDEEATETPDEESQEPTAPPVEEETPEEDAAPDEESEPAPPPQPPPKSNKKEAPKKK